MTMYSKWGLIYLSNYVAAYLSHKQNKTTLEIQDIEHYTATSNLSFFHSTITNCSMGCMAARKILFEKCVPSHVTLW